MAIHTLLTATDFSVTAGHAVERAALLAAESGARLALIHVANLAPMEKLRWLALDLPPRLEQHLIDAAATALRSHADALRERHGLAADIHLASGALVEEIATHAQALPADLLLLGARGTTQVRHLLLGSTAERLIGRSSCPLLVVKQAPRGRGAYRRVLVPVDFSPASLAALRCARAVAPGAEITLLHAFTAPFEGMLEYANVEQETIRRHRLAARQDAWNKLHQLCQAAELPPEEVRFLVHHGSPAPHILEQEHVHRCDLIAMGKQGAGRLGDLLLGSVTRRVTAESGCDVLVVG